jgi:hypothetical protein
MMREQRPGNASILVGQRNSSDIVVASGQQTPQPIIGSMGSVFEMSKHCARSMDEQRVQIDITVLADAEQPGLAA